MKPAVLRRDQAELELLLRQAQAGCSSAIGELIEQFRPMMLQIANEQLNPRLRQKVGASDVVQNTCLEAIGSISRFRGSNHPQLAAWLIKILKNNLADSKRHFETAKRNISRELNQRSDSEVYPSQSILVESQSASQLQRDETSEEERHAEIRKALDSLTETEHCVIVFRSRDRLSFAEIGERVNKSAEAARKIWVRAIESLQEKMKSNIELDQ